ncbi:P-loop containing nucleoside triphosphate hydrolase protein [Roridomyces roridus]|uniref:DNA 3'-5' helicase n=1 Tax=Roridomyces roridus TaxID=1738132 RepID=A0AAD7B1F2_9AGAR|nr:P-loop containing nucleoside triphosphate hydrolase protein [Roridomyces roridus]
MNELKCTADAVTNPKEAVVSNFPLLVCGLHDEEEKVPESRPRGTEFAKDVIEQLAMWVCRQKWGWDAELKPGQVEAIKAQLLGRDVLVHAATGYGKTCIAAGPHTHAKAAGCVTIMVSPLIGLQEEMVETFKTEFKLSAIAVNSSHGGCTPEALDTRQLTDLQEIVKGKYQIILISPELLLSNRFLDVVMRNSAFTRKILSVVIDEAHVVSHWGSQFRKQYGYLGLIRSFIPRGASIVAMSATLSSRVRQDVLDKLYFGGDYLVIDVGNDRPNVSLVVRAIHQPMNSYRDLDFVIPEAAATLVDIPLTWIYADNINTGIEIEDHLTELLPTSLQELGIIRPYNAAYSKEYRAEVMRLVREGSVRILVCTDAAGMGCNIPNIDVVVQWKLPSSTSSFLQRAGRAARRLGRQGLAVLLVEPSAYETDLFVAEPQISNPEKSTKKPTTRTKAQIKAYAASRGVLRGSNERQDALLSKEEPPIDPTSKDEALSALVQTTTCRRALLKKIYNNTNTTSSTGPCCDVCAPELLDRTRPGDFQAPARRSAVTRGIPSVMVQEKLHEWRTKIKKRDFSGAMFSAEGILRRETMIILSSVGPISTRPQLNKVLGDQWKWADRYGDELLAFLKSINMPAYKPKPRKSSTKRKEGGAVEGEKEAAAKRPRTTPVNEGRSRVGVTASSVPSLLPRSTSMPQLPRLPSTPSTPSPATPSKAPQPPYAAVPPAPHQTTPTRQGPWNHSPYGVVYPPSPLSSSSRNPPSSSSQVPSTPTTPMAPPALTPAHNPYMGWLSFNSPVYRPQPPPGQ